MQNQGLPQAGIITSLDRDAGKAKVFLPIYKIETGWILVSTNLLYETKLVFTDIVVSSPTATTVEAATGTVDAPASCPGTFSTWEAVNMSAASATAPVGAVERVEYGTLQVGDEVVVVFLNGDINQGRVIARF